MSNYMTKIWVCAITLLLGVALGYIWGENAINAEYAEMELKFARQAETIQHFINQDMLNTIRQVNVSLVD